MPSISVRQPDGSLDERTVPEGTTAAELFPDRSVVVARVAGQLKDLTYALRDGDEVEPVTIDSPDGLAILRHSTAHVLAQAVQQLVPGGEARHRPADPRRLLLRLRRRASPSPPRTSRRSRRHGARSSSRASASRAASSPRTRRAPSSPHEPYKLELIGLKGEADGSTTDGESVEVGGAELTIYDNLDGKTGERVLEGPVPRPAPAEHPHDRRLQAACAPPPPTGAAARRTRSCSASTAPRGRPRTSCSAHLAFLEEAEKRDHRKLGAELDLFSFPDEIGSGLAVFHPKGGIIRREMEDYSRASATRRRATSSSTPRTSPRRTLFEISGHLDWYADGMFPPMDLDEERDADGQRHAQAPQNYYLKPMNCPMHNLIFDARGRSYRELPLRLFEFGTVYRYEKSGVSRASPACAASPRTTRTSTAPPSRCPDELDSLLDLRARPAARLRPRRLLPRAVDQGPREVRRHRRGVGGGHRDPAAGGRAAGPRARAWTRAAPRSTARRSRCRRATRSAAPGRCRPSRSTSTCPSGSTSSTPPPTARGSAR